MIIGYSLEYILCSLSQIYLANEHCPTLSFTGSGNPSRIKSIAILMFLFNSLLVVVFGFFEALYPIMTEYQTSHPCVRNYFFIIMLHIS
jgi:hypothetical protein